MTMQRTSGSASKRSSPASDPLRISCESELRVSGWFEPQQADVEVVDRGLDDPGQGAQLSSKGSIALIPVAARPMISFWICEVPS